MPDTKVTPTKAPIVETKDRQPMDMQFEVAESVKAAHPDRHFRFVNTQRRELGDLRTKVQGYSPLEGAESVTIGELRLMSCPKALQEERLRRVAIVTRTREGKIAEQAKENMKKLGVRPTDD